MIKTGRFVYVARTAKDFTISQMMIQFYLANAAVDARPAQTALLTLKGDSVIVEVGSGVQKQTQRIKTAAGAVMLPPSSFTAFEQLTMKQRAAGGAISVPVFATAGGATATVTLTPAGSDSVVAKAKHGWMIPGRQVYHPENASRGFDKLMELFDDALQPGERVTKAARAKSYAGRSFEDNAAQQTPYA